RWPRDWSSDVCSSDLWLKRIGFGILALLLLIVIAAGSVYAIVGRKLEKRYPTQVAAVPVPTDSASIERGHHLVVAVNKCVGCHRSEERRVGKECECGC